jgi:agmatine/peptidylarginine deiminase
MCLQPDHIARGYVPRLANARLPGSYINHYCANGGVVVPQFGYPTGEGDRQTASAAPAELSWCDCVVHHGAVRIE